MKYLGRKTIIQNHSLLARRLRSMARAVDYKPDLPADEMLKARSLEEQALEHERKASLFKHDTFIMIL